MFASLTRARFGNRLERLGVLILPLSLSRSLGPLGPQEGRFAMMHRRLLLIVLTFSLISCCASTGEYQVGLAQVDITPEYPIRLNGFGNRRSESEGVTAKIFAKAMAIDDGGDGGDGGDSGGRRGGGPAVIVTVDNLGVPDYLT